MAAFKCHCYYTFLALAVSISPHHKYSYVDLYHHEYVQAILDRDVFSKNYLFIVYTNTRTGGVSCEGR